MSDAADVSDHTPDYNKYPWKHVNSLTQIYKDSPVLLTMELAILTIYLILLVHSIRRRTLGVLIAATVAGAANELAFTSAPGVNNFWHAQAWLMLGPRMPAWQPALYGFFLYTATQSAGRLRSAGWHPIGRAAASGLLGCLLLFPLDAVCVRFVAYTWHESDPLLADRLLGVAAGNAMFAAAFPLCFTGLHDALGPLAAGALSTPAMVVLTMPFTQFVGEGLPTRGSLVMLLGVIATVAMGAAALAARPAHTERQRKSQHRPDWIPMLVALGHFAVLLTVAAVADPTAQKSVGFHQPMSIANFDGEPCRDDTDLTASGHVRRVFLCPQSLSASAAAFDVTCDPIAGIDQHWYAVCGRPFGYGAGGIGGGRTQFVVSLAILASLGMAGLVGCQVD